MRTGAFLVGIGFKPVCFHIARVPGNYWRFEVHHYIEFDDEYVHTNFENGYRVRIPWEMVRKVVLTPEHILLYYLADVTTIAPRASLSNSADEQRLHDFLMARNLVASPFPPRSSAERT